MALIFTRTAPLGGLFLRLVTARPVVSLLERVGASPHGVRQGPPVPAVALTFDDGPHPAWTPRVLDALDAGGAKGTFFVVGRWAEKHPDILRDARKRGHEIGTHLWSHQRDAVRSDWRFREELEKSRALLESLLGEPLVWLRYPYGVRGSQRTSIVESAHGLRVAHWTASSHDTRLRDPADIVARASSALRPGAILLLHDRLADAGPDLPAPYVAERGALVAALPDLLRIVKDRGFEALTLSDLFKR